MKLKLVVLAALMAVVGCASVSTAPVSAPKVAQKDVLECRSGYHVATRTDGSEYCEQDQ